MLPRNGQKRQLSIDSDSSGEIAKKISLRGTSHTEAPDEKRNIHLSISISLLQNIIADLLPSNKKFKSILTTSLLLHLPVTSNKNNVSILGNFDEVLSNPWCTSKDIRMYHSKEYTDIILDDRFNYIGGKENLSHLQPYIDALNQHQKYFQQNVYINEENASDSNSESEHSENFEVTQNTDEILKYLEIKGLYAGSSNNMINMTKISNEIDQSSDDENDHNDLEPHVIEFINSDMKQIVHGYTKKTLMEHNLVYDCPIFPLLPIYCHVIAGATLSVVQSLIKNNEVNGIGINLDGGRHHAFKNKGNGFCYVNDIVLAINKFRMHNIKKITYIDFDLHHGDGVEYAFSGSKNVQTISLHFAEYGFFPNSGDFNLKDHERQCFNFVLPRRTNDESYLSMVQKKVLPIIEEFEPNVIVLQCGGDGLKTDDYDIWSLSIQGLCKAILSVLHRFGQKSKILILGGGGYNVSLQARFNAYLVYKIVEFAKSETNLLEEDYTFEVIPEHCFLDFYKKSFYKFFI